MAPRRVSKNSKTLKINYNSLVLNDVLCPICRSILIEPVTLPCQHGFCSSCFEGTMENANLVCPLCRVRIGSWLRRTKKEEKLVNCDLWNAIKKKFPQQVKNKLNGIDEDFEEEPEIIVSYPGEIRKEYEIQKQKEDEEFRKKCEADIRASEDLIIKIRQEEEYERAVREEKIKLDEQMAKRLAEDLALISPSTSKGKQAHRKLGPIDKFVRLENENATSPDNKKRPVNNFATKEYTCRVLCLESKNKSTQSSASEKVFSPIIKKKNQQIQKIADVDVTSDSSDCIESELRYFKPIDHRLNPPLTGKPPIRVPTIKPLKNTTTRIISPSGLINFQSNFLESAFARLQKSLTLSSAIINKKDDCLLQGVANNTPTTNNLKRNHDDDMCISSKRKNKRKGSNQSNEDVEKKESLVINNFKRTGRIRKHINGKPTTSVPQRESPPFYGFENSAVKSNSNIAKKNGIKNTLDDEQSKKLLQEMADLEFAKKLQDKFNRNAHYTRSSRRTSGPSKRQSTLDEIIKTVYRVK